MTKITIQSEFSSESVNLSNPSYRNIEHIKDGIYKSSTDGREYALISIDTIDYKGIDYIKRVISAFANLVFGNHSTENFKDSLKGKENSVQLIPAEELGAHYLERGLKNLENAYTAESQKNAYRLIAKAIIHDYNFLSEILPSKEDAKENNERMEKFQSKREEALDVLNNRAIETNQYATYEIGNIYLNGAKDFLYPDLKTGAIFILESARQGNPEAIKDLLNLSPNLKKGIELLGELQDELNPDIENDENMPLYQGIAEILENKKIKESTEPGSEELRTLLASVIPKQVTEHLRNQKER